MGDGDIVMSQKEILRHEIIISLGKKILKQEAAAKKLGISVRQVKRLYRKYKSSGVTGLISKRRGKRSNNKISEEIKKQALSLVLTNYADFGPTLAMEKLQQNHGINVSKETLRKWMIGEKIWAGKKRKRLVPHQLRERRPRFGELVQIDGSPHDWFEGRAEPCCLLVFIDDATSKILQLLFVPVESTAGYFRAARQYIEKHGVPLAFYSDKHSIFRINMPEGMFDGETQFQRVARELGIELICANSPQAKGRVERANGILQDRLVKELRLLGISDIETANTYLPEFVKQYNEKFAKEPKDVTDMHRRLNKSAQELDIIFSEQHKRKLSKNLECSFKNKIYQIQISGYGYSLRNATVTICENTGGVVHLLCMGKERAYKCYEKSKRPPEIVDTKHLNRKVDNFVKWKPAPNHPWRQYKNIRDIDVKHNGAYGEYI
jgi:transposase